MQPTKKLYDLDAYATSFEACVLSCEKIENDKETVYQVVLDQTLFFPEEGGQSPDQGTIHGIEVIDVQIKEERILHTLVAEVTEGAKVEGRIDWKHRFNNMQQHTGEHIFSGLVHGKYGYDNVGFHLSNQVVTMDFNGVLTLEQALAIEQQANEAIINNLEVQVSFPSKEQLSVLDYRSKIEIDGQVRIVTIPNVDVCACCAPHVKRTGEIGMLKVMSLQNYKGGVRISILCGFRVLEEFRNKTAIISELTTMLSANQDTLIDSVNKVKTTNQSLKNELVTAKQEYIKAKLAAIPKEAQDVVLFEKNLDSQVMRNAVNQLVTAHAGIVAIFCGDDKEGYRFIIGSNDKDAKSALEKLKEIGDVRGGGNQKMVQGSIVASKEDIIKTVK